MFSKIYMRYKIAFVWMIAFVALWIVFQIKSPLNNMKYQLDMIEQSIVKKDWKQANEYTTQFRNTFINNRTLIQTNNSTEAVISFDHTIGQLEITVKHNQESSLEYVGALKELLKLVVKPFSGP